MIQKLVEIGNVMIYRKSSNSTYEEFDKFWNFQIGEFEVLKKKKIIFFQSRK